MHVVWYPPSGASVTFETGSAATYRLVSLDGVGPVPVTTAGLKSPKQAGETPLDVLVPARVVVLQALVQAASNEALWPLRAALARALVSQPVRPDEDIQLGRLRVYRDGGMDPLELDAVVRSASMPAPKGGIGLLPIDVEFYAPSPWWRELADSTRILESEGGFEWGLEFDLEMGTNNITVEIENHGDVDTPILARLYGEGSDPVISNDTYGQAIGIIGDVEADQYVEIDTAFGQSTIHLVDGGVATSAMDLLALDVADDFWVLRPGLNTVSFEATPNVSARAVIIWREQFSGI